MTVYQWLCLFGVQGGMTAIAGVIIGLINGRIQRNVAKKMAKEDRCDIMCTALCDLVRKKLYDMYKEALANDCQVTFEDRQNFDHLYKSYIGLGGNSYMPQLEKEYMEFKVVE